MGGMIRVRPCLIDWDDGNWAHFQAHGRCTKKQVEDVVASTCHVSLREHQQGATFIYYGITGAGRNLCVVAEVRRLTSAETAEARVSGRVHGLTRATAEARTAADATTQPPKPLIIEHVRPITCGAMGATALAGYYSWRTTTKVK
jgi:hypothetical protein